MKPRSALKQASLQRILESGAKRLRAEGLSGAGIAAVMKDAGLTHGAFYSHFNNKEELLAATLRRALAENRPRWIHSKKRETWAGRLRRLARRYLTAAHRDNLSDSCALAALLSEAARSSPAFRHVYETELKKTVAAICGDPPCDAAATPKRFEETILFLALCMGGLSLSRAVETPTLSDQILAVCRNGAQRVVEQPLPVSRNRGPDSPGQESAMDRSVDLDDFPVTTYEKLRYADTDRQGHVNNAVFSTMLETGRVEILYDPEAPLAGPGCAFVIAGQHLDFHSEINWPGRVDIGTRVLKVGRSSITLEQALFQERRLTATATTVIVQMNEVTRRSEPLNAAALKRLNSLTASQKAEGPDKE